MLASHIAQTVYDERGFLPTIALATLKNAAYSESPTGDVVELDPANPISTAFVDSVSESVAGICCMESLDDHGGRLASGRPGGTIRYVITRNSIQRVEAVKSYLVQLCRRTLLFVSLRQAATLHGRERTYGTKGHMLRV